MDVAGRIGQYVALEFFVDVRRIGRSTRGGTESRLRTSAERLPYRALPRRAQNRASSTIWWPSWRRSSQPRASVGSREISGDDVVVLDEGLELEEELAVFRVVAGFLIVLSGEAPDCLE